jgi:ADP-heptose:LPS heptosyltransferase
MKKINNKERSTAFYINGGIGRVVCAIPALEKYLENNPQDDFIIFSEFAYEAFSGHPTLHARAYPSNLPHLFRDKLKDRNVVMPEPYYVWEYYNQKCSIAQAFDMEINGSLDQNLSIPKIYLSNEEKLTAINIIKDMKSKRNKPMIMFQPFGKGITLNAVQTATGPVDSTGRSLSINSAAKLIKLLEYKYSILLMNEFNVDFRAYGCKEETFYVENANLRKWFGLINAADAFLGCDSIGQHIANSFNKNSYIILGSTFAENVSYPNNEWFNIFDFNKDKKQYSPIRITVDECADRQNEPLMELTDDQLKQIADKILNDLQ